MVRPMLFAELARKKAPVVFETVWKVRRSVGKVGKRMWNVCVLFGKELGVKAMRSCFTCSRNRGVAASLSFDDQTSRMAS